MTLIKFAAFVFAALFLQSLYGGVGVAEKVCGFIMLVPSAFSQSISAFVGADLKNCNLRLTN